MPSMNEPDNSTIYVITGPGGSGKSLLAELLSYSLKKVVPYTTRLPRPGEKDGVDYRFVSLLEFANLVSLGKMICIRSFRKGDEVIFYGIDSEDLTKPLDKFRIGRVVVLDPQGAQELFLRFGYRVKIFDLYISQNDARARMVARGDSEQDVAQRLKRDAADFSHMYSPTQTLYQPYTID